ncbi:hypothetical protein SAMN05518847_111130 [Paenibacillus sp. OV219]|nr:hypothetical protein SAMN05518847_111130 [Paenibacillus sp. OV219]
MGLLYQIYISHIENADLGDTAEAVEDREQGQEQMEPPQLIDLLRRLKME